MKLRLTDILCTRCGLCCGGDLFADVELSPSDHASDLEGLGLEIEDDDDRAGGELLVQPCAALRGTRCSIYPHRPKCCQTFECRLLRKVKLGVISIPDAQNRIADIRNRISGLHQRVDALGSVAKTLSLSERCHEALAQTEDATDPTTVKRRSELERESKSLGRELQRVFL